MKKLLNHVLVAFFKLFELRDTIVFESNPDYACNTYPVYKVLSEKLPEYKFVWMVNKNTPKRDGVDDVAFLNSNSIKRLYYLFTSKVFISCNRFTQKQDPRQCSLFLCHGSKTKKTKGSYEMGHAVDYINVQSHFFDEITQFEYSCNKEQLVYLGYPRCDYFYRSRNDNVFNLLDGKKENFIMWLPTFRTHKNGREDCKETQYDNIGMPLIYSNSMLMDFNEFLKGKNVHIVYKPHPAQDVSVLLNSNMSNIHVVYDKDILDEDLQLYEVIAQSDALITDYSSVFFDYLLLDRPIATTTDDIESWKEGRGFAFDLEAMYDKATIRVPDLQGLKKFINHVYGGIDEKMNGRREIRDLTNMYQDGNSAERVADFIIEKLGEKKL